MDSYRFTAAIGPRSNSKGGKPNNIANGKATLRLRATGPATVEAAVRVCSSFWAVVYGIRKQLETVERSTELGTSFLWIGCSFASEKKLLAPIQILFFGNENIKYWKCPWNSFENLKTSVEYNRLHPFTEIHLSAVEPFLRDIRVLEVFFKLSS